MTELFSQLLLTCSVISPPLFFFSYLTTHHHTIIPYTTFLQSTVYRIVLLNGGLAEYEAVLKEYRDTEDNQVGRLFLYCCQIVTLQSLCAILCE